jgi:two-component system sensor kinase FixL
MIGAAVVGWFVFQYVADSFLQRYEERQRVLAVSVSDTFEHRIRQLVSRTAAAVAADMDSAPATAAGREWLRVLMAEQHIDWRLWREQADGFVTEPSPIAGLPEASDFSAAARQAVGSGEPTFSESPAPGDPTEKSLSVVVPLQSSASPHRLMQFIFSSQRVGHFLASETLGEGTLARLVAPDGTSFGGPDAMDANTLRNVVSQLSGSADVPWHVEEERGRLGARWSISTAPVLGAPGWRVLLIAPSASEALEWALPVWECGLATLGTFLFTAVVAVLMGTLITRPLTSLTHDFDLMAAGSELPPEAPSHVGIEEFIELRASLRRSTAVLRQRAAAERMALNEARTGHQLLASVITATEDLIYVKSLDLRIVLANRATLAAGGVERQEWQVFGRTIAELLPPDAAAQEETMDRRVLAGGESDTTRLDWPDTAGRMRSFMLTKSLWRDDAGRITGVVTVARDVTDERAAESRLAAVQADLLRVSRLSAMGAMASGLAHELNQPLAAATNFLNAAGRFLPDHADKPTVLDVTASGTLRGAVKDAAEQMLRAGDIVRRLRVFIGRGEAELRHEDLGDVIRETCALATADLSGFSSALTMMETRVGARALIDRTQLQQVLLNLIRNAREAIGGAAAGRIEIGCHRSADGTTRITVSDNGPGLASDVVPRLFEPFVSTKSDGMGIGLAICRTIVEGHGGRLSAAARPGGGTVFTIILPAANFPSDEEARRVA